MPRGAVDANGMAPGPPLKPPDPPPGDPVRGLVIALCLSLALWVVMVGLYFWAHRPRG